MPQSGKSYGERFTDDIIREILREYASRENPIGNTGISRIAKQKGYSIGRTAINGFRTRMGAKEYETEEQCDELLIECNANERETVFCKFSSEGKKALGYWMMEVISESEWMYLMDSVLYSKILTKKEADNLAKRITVLAGKKVSDLTRYRHRMENQPYFVGDEDIEKNIGRIESRVLKQVHLIREAIKCGKKVKFNLCVYDYFDQKVRLVPYGKHGKVNPEVEGKRKEKYKEDAHRICSPFEVIFSNGRYYMLGADIETERRTDLKYKLYRVDLMDNLSINRATAITKEEASIQELTDLFKYRMENPHMFTGKVEKVRIRVDADQFTQIIDWFGSPGNSGNSGNSSWTWIGGSVEGEDKEFCDIEVKVNINSFAFWVLQYSGCVKVLDTGKKAEHSYRNHIRETLKRALERYEEDE